MTDTTTPEILLKAADVIKTRGWCCGSYRDPFGPAVCLVGAISVAAGLAPDAIGTPGGAPEQVHAAIAALDGWLAPGMDIVDWNDEVAEDSAQVMTLLRECAAALQAGAR